MPKDKDAQSEPSTLDARKAGDPSAASEQDAPSDEWSGTFQREHVDRSDDDVEGLHWHPDRSNEGSNDEVAGHVENASAEDASPEGGHEAWSQADDANLWGQQQEAWKNGAGSERGQGAWSTDAVSPKTKDQEDERAGSDEQAASDDTSGKERDEP